jgi:uncharacterized integral membrane protein
MAEEKTQNYQNHVRFHPLFHFFLLPMLLLNFVACVIHAWRHQTPFNIWIAVMGIVLFILAGLARMFALRAQDRVIRLEERMRLTSLCGEPMRSRLYQLTTRQLIGLRFASDGEVCALAARALDENLTEKQIKQAIVNWRGDYCRV